MAFASNLKFPSERAGYKIVLTRFLEKYEIYYHLKSRAFTSILGLINLLFPSELGYNYYLLYICMTKLNTNKQNLIFLRPNLVILEVERSVIKDTVNLVYLLSFCLSNYFLFDRETETKKEII